MEFGLTVDGVDMIAQNVIHIGPGSPSLDLTLQARGLFHFEMKDRAGYWVPQLNKEVLVTLDGYRIFGGVITGVEESDWGDYKGVWSKVEVSDFAAPLEGMEYNGIVAGPTLREILLQIVALRLAPLGYSVHPAMGAGPSIGPLGWGFRYIREIFDDLTTMTQWPWIITPYKQILFAPPASVIAPIELKADNDTINTISVSHTLSDYVNVVWIHYGATGNREVTDTWKGDGSNKLFKVSFPQPEGVVERPYAMRVNGTSYPVAIWGVDSGWWFYWRASDAAIIHDLGLPAFTAADTLEATYTANFPGAVYARNDAEVAAYGEHAIIEAQPAIFDRAQADAVAAGRLIERGGLLRRIHLTTHTPGLQVGQCVLVDVPERSISGYCLVLSVQMSLDGIKAEDNTEWWKFVVELVEGTPYKQTWQKFWNVNASTGSAQSGSGSVGPPVGGGGGGSTGSGPGTQEPIYFGGERQTWFSGAGWQPIPGFVDVLLSPTIYASVTIHCQSWVLAAGMTINVRLVALDGTVVGTGTATGATSATAGGAFQNFTATLLAAPQFYRLEAQLTGTDAEGAVAGVVAHPTPVTSRAAVRRLPEKVA